MNQEAEKKGYIKLYRKSTDKEVFKNPYAWQLFTYCLLNARFKGDDAGTFITTQNEIRKDLKWSRNTVIKFMKFLKDIDCIDYEGVTGNTGKTIIKVRNFNRYQDI